MICHRSGTFDIYLSLSAVEPMEVPPFIPLAAFQCSEVLDSVLSGSSHQLKSAHLLNVLRFQQLRFPMLSHQSCRHLDANRFLLSSAGIGSNLTGSIYRSWSRKRKWLWVRSVLLALRVKGSHNVIVKSDYEDHNSTNGEWVFWLPALETF